MASSKVYVGWDPGPAKNDGLIGALKAVGAMPICIVGFELDLFNTPSSTHGFGIQGRLDHVSQQCGGGINVYVHFSSGRTSWQKDGDLGSVFWTNNVGILTGMLHQADPGWDCPTWQSRLYDIQARFGAGVSGWPTD